MSNARNLSQLRPNSTGLITTSNLPTDGSWVPSGGVIAVSTVRNSTRTALSNTSEYVAFSGSFTKKRSDSIIIAQANVYGNSFQSGNCGVGLKLDSTWDFGSSYQYDGAWNQALQVTIVTGNGLWTGVSSGSHTMGWGWKTANGSSAEKPFDFLNPNGTSDARIPQITSTIVIYEIAP